MNTPVHVTNSPIQSVSDWRKRPNTSDYSDSEILEKRRRCQYYYILASESSMSEDEGSESVESIQGQETELCKDTTDTDTKSEESEDFDLNVEYEIISSSEPEENPFADGSSSGEDALIAAGAVVSQIAAKSDVELWVTDGDDETDSDTSIFESQLFKCQKCKKCRIRETVSCFPLCSYCYQIRKNCYPPRPRHKKSKLHETHNRTAPVTRDRLSACLNVLSQDSGLGSSQDMQSSSSQLQTMAWDKVVIPKNLIKPTESITSASESFGSSHASSFGLTSQTVENWKSAASEMCIMCNAMPKNGIFVHGTTGHMCCCYSCAVKFWTKSKRCAWCNLKAKNVVKAFFG